ncbi:hypothetical protein KM043_012615 [Ampulex compressa]|nr:hypothetical protein KM043_012615 [Ampulex compressa]
MLFKIDITLFQGEKVPPLGARGYAVAGTRLLALPSILKLVVCVITCLTEFDPVEFSCASQFWETEATASVVLRDGNSTSRLTHPESLLVDATIDCEKLGRRESQSLLQTPRDVPSFVTSGPGRG